MWLTIVAESILNGMTSQPSSMCTVTRFSICAKCTHYPDIDDPSHPLIEDELSNMALGELVKAATDNKEAWGEQRV